MNLLAITALAAVAATGPAPDAARTAAATFPSATIELEDRPLRLAVLARGGRLDVLLLRDRELGRFRLEGRTLVPTGRFQVASRSRPLLVDAAPDPSGGAPLVAVVFGEDVLSVDRGTDTRLHAFVLSAGEDGELRVASGDLEGWLRITDGRIHVQRRGMDELFAGRVRRVEKTSGRYVPGGAEIPWADRWLLEATPLLGGAEALAWDGARPRIVKLAGGARVPGGSIVGDLGKIEEPALAIAIERPILKGIDREGNVKDSWRPLPRRVSVAADGAAYTVLRERSKPFFGKTSGQDVVARLEWSGDSLALSRPYPGIDAFLLDFALIERPGRRPAAVLLVNEKEDGSGRAHLVFQEPLDDARP